MTALSERDTDIYVIGDVNPDILVIGGPIWLGDNSSVTRRVIERLYGSGMPFNLQITRLG